MRQVLYWMFITLLNVHTYVTLDIKYNLVDNDEKIPESTPSNNIMPITLKPKTNFAYTEKGCYIGHSMCLYYYRAKQDNEVCAYHTNFKLINFANFCEVYLQNCLYLIEKKAKKPHVPDNFYYNEQDRNCQYYLRKGKTLEEAIKLYNHEVLKKG